jgi:4-amino-4-deoxy-L-arabinose transferase-like glycosyltransferase
LQSVADPTASPDVTTSALPAWRNAEMRTVGDQWFNTMGHDTARLLLLGRAWSGLLAVALGAVVWFWARQLFGPAAAMLALLLYVLNPAILANCALMKDDVAGALFFLLATWRAGAVLQRCSLGNVLLSALATVGLFVSKMSAFLLVPIAGVLVIARLWEHRPWLVTGLGEVARRATQAVVLAAVVLAHAVATVFVIWACHGFR